MGFRSFLVLALLLIVFLSGTSAVFGATHTVNPTQNNNVIQNILNHANPGDIIEFLTGTYQNIELTINKSLKIIAHENVTLNGTGIPTNSSILTIATSVNNVLIQGFNLENGYFGIENNGTGTKITNNTFTQNWDGILSRGNQANITQNAFINESWDAIVSYADNAIIHDNYMENHTWVSIFSQGKNASIKNNTITQNQRYAIHSEGNHAKIINNQIFNNGDVGIHSNGSHTTITNNTLENNTDAIYTSGNNTTILYNIINNSTRGIISHGQFTTVNENHIQQSLTAIRIYESQNQITQNNITNNTQGILITGLYNILENNTLQRNQIALISTSSSTIQNNNITHNNQGIIINGNWNNILHNYLENNINALNILGNWTQVQENTLTSNQNGINITGDNNTFWLNLIDNSTQGIIINGDNNFLLQNTIQNNLDGIINNAAQNILNYNRITNQVTNIINQNNHNINANYNWWGKNNPIKIIGNNVNTTKYVIGQINIENTTIEMDTIYNITIKLTDQLENNLTLDIPSFPIKFQFDGDIYPNQTTIFHNQAQTQIQVFNEGNYTLTAQLDQETLTLTLKTPDITPPTIQAQITPPISSSGKNITINATSDADTEKITAQIMGTVYYLTQNLSGDWFLNYTIPPVTDDIYNILLQATDYTGNIGNQTLNFTVDNTPPLINANTAPNITSSGSNVIIKALSSNDTVNVTAQILGNSYDLVFSGGEWFLDYVVPEITDGMVNILLTATDQAGNTAQNTTNFTVDNTLPQLLASVNPNLTKTGQIIQIKANTDTGVTNLTAKIEGTIYNLINKGNGTWILNYTVPQLKDGFHNILLTAIDQVGNTGTGWTGFNVDNTPPHINPTITIKNNQIYLKTLSDPDTVKITVQIDGKTYNLQSQGNNTWTLNNPVTLKNGEYNLLFNAEDQLQNQAQLIKKITIENTSILNQHNPITPSNIIGGSVGEIAKIHGSTNQLNNSLNSNNQPILKQLNDLLSKIDFIKNIISFVTLGSEFQKYYNTLSPSIQKNPFINSILTGYQVYLAFNWNTLPYFIWERMNIEPNSNLWDFINPPGFIHFYGTKYEHLDPNTKWWLEFITGVDEKGNMSFLNWLLTLLILLPSIKGITLLSKIPLINKITPLTRLLPKNITTYLTKTWEKIQKLIDPVLMKIPISRESLIKVWNILVDGADLVGLKPSVWWKYIENTSLGKWLSSKFGSYTTSMTKYHLDFWKALADADLAYPLEITGKYLGLKKHPITGSILKNIAGTVSIYFAVKSSYEVFNWYDVNIRQPVMKPLNNLIQKTKKDLVNTVKKGFNKVKAEIKEIKRKGPVKYLQGKTRQLQKTYKSYKKTYKTRFKPLMQKYVKTQTHKYLKPIAKHPVTKWLVKNVPGAKKITKGLSWTAKKLGIW